MPTTENSGARSGGLRSLWLRRVAWLVVLWASSVAALAVVAWLLRLFMTAAGLHT
jgi:hypothetical protein